METLEFTELGLWLYKMFADLLRQNIYYSELNLTHLSHAAIRSFRQSRPKTVGSYNWQASTCCFRRRLCVYIDSGKNISALSGK